MVNGNSLLKFSYNTTKNKKMQVRFQKLSFSGNDSTTQPICVCWMEVLVIV